MQQIITRTHTHSQLVLKHILSQLKTHNNSNNNINSKMILNLLSLWILLAVGSIYYEMFTEYVAKSNKEEAVTMIQMCVHNTRHKPIILNMIVKHFKLNLEEAKLEIISISSPTSLSKNAWLMKLIIKCYFRPFKHNTSTAMISKNITPAHVNLFTKPVQLAKQSVI